MRYHKGGIWLGTTSTILVLSTAFGATFNVTDQLKVGGNAYFANGTWRSNDNVGIGTTAPGQKLDVAGQIRWSNNTLPSGTGAANGVCRRCTQPNGAQGDGEQIFLR